MRVAGVLARLAGCTARALGTHQRAVHVEHRIVGRPWQHTTQSPPGKFLCVSRGACTGEARKGAVHGVVRKDLAVDAVLAAARNRADHVRRVDVLDVCAGNLVFQDLAEVAANVAKLWVARGIELARVGQQALQVGSSAWARFGQCRCRV